MWKKILISTIVVFISMAILDMLIHGFMLKGIYEETKELWRPMDEMKWGTMYIASFISIFFLNLMYSKMVNPKSLKNGILFGLFWGIAYGASWAYGAYAMMPMPYSLAMSWFLAAVFELTVAGLLIGLIIKDTSES